MQRDQEANAANEAIAALNSSEGSARVASGDGVVPHENDILLGRGGKNNQSPGNARLRMIALELCPFYRSAPKKAKPGIANALVTRIRELTPPGRFLKFSEKGWHEVSPEVAVEKASQCLRDTVASIKKGSMDSSKRQKSKDTASVLDRLHSAKASEDNALAAGNPALCERPLIGAAGLGAVDHLRDIDLLRQHYLLNPIQSGLPSRLASQQNTIQDLLLNDALQQAELRALASNTVLAARRRIMLENEALSNPLVALQGERSNILTESPLLSAALAAEKASLAQALVASSSGSSLPMGLSSLNSSLAGIQDNALRRLQEGSRFK